MTRKNVLIGLLYFLESATFIFQFEIFSIALFNLKTKFPELFRAFEFERNEIFACPVIPDFWDLFRSIQPEFISVKEAAGQATEFWIKGENIQPYVNMFNSEQKAQLQAAANELRNILRDHQASALCPLDPVGLFV